MISPYVLCPEGKAPGSSWYSYRVESNQLLIQAQRLQALAQAGLAYTDNPYDVERYSEIRAISVRRLQELTEEPFEKIIRVFASEDGYQTPKIDVRAVLFREGPEILLIREKIDQGRWTLPGGWADVGYTPFEVAPKEAYEETGLVVRPVRLLARLTKGSIHILPTLVRIQGIYSM